MNQRNLALLWGSRYVANMVSQRWARVLFVTVFAGSSCGLGCEYVETGSDADTGEAGALAALLGDSGGGGSAANSQDDTTGAFDTPCLRACAATAKSSCPDAETNIETCTNNCLSAVEGSCGRAFVTYLVCAQDEEDITCTGYGPAAQGCEDSYYGFIDCMM